MSDSLPPVPARPPPGSRFAEEPEWDVPGDHSEYVMGLLPFAEGDELALLRTAAGRTWFSDCTAEEQAAIHAVGYRREGRAPP